ncbi:MAG: hypothetical protein RR416_05055 [Clostridia bacterium]
MAKLATLNNRNKTLKLATVNRKATHVNAIAQDKKGENGENCEICENGENNIAQSPQQVNIIVQNKKAENGENNIAKSSQTKK